MRLIICGWPGIVSLADWRVWAVPGFLALITLVVTLHDLWGRWRR